MIEVRPLAGSIVELIPLSRTHRDSLVAASSDGDLSSMKLTVVPGESTIDAFLDEALEGQRSGSVIPYAIKANGIIVGSTRFWRLDLRNRSAEIGRTWISESHQKTGVNTECKYLMLRYAFEELGLIRVQFTTDVLNKNSQRAILRLGAVAEGVIRNERIMPDGRYRDSVRYSIIDSDWPAIKLRLANMMKR